MCMDALMSREHRGEAEQKKVQWTFFPLSGRGRMPSPGFRAKQDSAAKKVRSDLPLRHFLILTTFAVTAPRHTVIHFHPTD